MRSLKHNRSKTQHSTTAQFQRIGLTSG